MPREPPVTTATRSFKLRIGEAPATSETARSSSGINRVLTFASPYRAKVSRFIDEPIEQCLRQYISLPGKFRVPFNAQHKPVAARIFHGFNQSVRRPGGRHQFPAHRFNRLMMVAIHRRQLNAGQLTEQTTLEDADAVRMAIAR